MQPSVSIVIPVYNGAQTIGPLVEKLVEHYGQRWRLEIVLVNDGSQDDSRAVCRELARSHPNLVRFLHLSRNFGEHQAVLAGLTHSSGQAVVVMDDDFQNPPEEVAKLVACLREEDRDVVYGGFRSKQHSLFRNLGSKFNDLVACWMLKKPRGLYLSSFKCMNRFLVEQVCRYHGPFPYLDGLILRVTRNIGVVEVEHKERAAGRSGYTFRKLIRLWLNMFTNFSIMPLRLAAVIGLVFSFLGVVGAVGVIVEKLLYPDIPVGYPSIVVTVLTFSGIQLMVMGVAGEYVGRMFLAQNETPQFVVRERWGFGEASGEGPSRHTPAEHESITTRP